MQSCLSNEEGSGEGVSSPSSGMSLIHSQGNDAMINTGNTGLLAVAHTMGPVTINQAGSKSGLPTSSSILPRNVELFGRKNEFNKVWAALSEDLTMAALVGAPGMGKSAIAASFVYKWLSEEAGKRFVFWISVDSEQNLRHSCLDVLAKFHEKPDKDKTSTLDLANLTREKLEGIPATHAWTLVFERVQPKLGLALDGPKAIEKWFLDRKLGLLAGRGRILFTTRYDSCLRDMSRNMSTVIKKVIVEKLEDEHAANMLLSGLDDEDVNEDTKQAAKELVSMKYFDGLPLAVSIANEKISTLYLFRSICTILTIT